MPFHAFIGKAMIAAGAEEAPLGHCSQTNQNTRRTDVRKNIAKITQNVYIQLGCKWRPGVPFSDHP